MTGAYVQLGLSEYDADRYIDCTDAEVLAALPILMAKAKHLESDGCLTRAQVRSRLAGFTAFADPGSLPDRIVAQGLATDIDGKTIQLVGWENWMKSHAELEEFRAERRRRAANGGEKSGKSRRNAKQAASPDGSSLLQHGEADDKTGEATQTDRPDPDAEPDQTDPDRGLEFGDNFEDADDGESSVVDEDKAEMVVKRYAEREAYRRGHTDEAKYITGICNKVRDERMHEVRHLCVVHPDDEVDQLVRRFERAS